MNRFPLLLTSIAFVFLTNLTGCSSFKTTNKSLSVHWQEPQKLYFQGKGAGAGMALMSTMGPMGMAIGVAIDEGISKDIAKAQTATGKTLQSIIEERWSDHHIEWVASNEVNNAEVLINKIGFELVRGGKDDATGVKIELTLDRGNGQQTILYPSDFPDHKPNSYPLEVLKKNGKASNRLLREAFSQIQILKL